MPLPTPTNGQSDPAGRSFIGGLKGITASAGTGLAERVGEDVSKHSPAGAKAVEGIGKLFGKKPKKATDEEIVENTSPLQNIQSILLEIRDAVFDIANKIVGQVKAPKGGAEGGEHVTGEKDFYKGGQFMGFRKGRDYDAASNLKELEKEREGKRAAKKTKAPTSVGQIKDSIKGEDKGGAGGMMMGLIGPGRLIAGIGKGIGKAIQGFLTGIAKGIGAFGNTKVFKGILAMALLGVSLIPFAFGLKQFTEIDWKQVALGGVALIGFSVVALVMGKMAGSMIMGAVAIGLLGVALIPFAFAVQMFTGLEWGTFFIAIAALSAFAVVAGLMGLATPFILLGALGIGALGVALIPFAYAMNLFSDAAVPFGEGFKLMAEGVETMVGSVGDMLTSIIDKFIELANAPAGGLLSAAGGILAVTAALAGFLALEVGGSVISGIGNIAGSALDAISGLYGGEPAKSPLDMLAQITGLGAAGGEGLAAAGMGIKNITQGLEDFAALDVSENTMKMLKVASETILSNTGEVLQNAQLDTAGRNAGSQGGAIVVNTGGNSTTSSSSSQTTAMSTRSSPRGPGMPRTSSIEKHGGSAGYQPS
jgi:hypothetical protein